MCGKTCGKVLKWGITYVHLNVSRSCDLRHLNIRTALCQPREYQKSHTSSSKYIRTLHKYVQPLDINLTASYNTFSKPTENTLMAVAYHQAQKVRYRVTLDLEVFEDMNPHQIQWDKALNLEPAEKVSAYVEDLSIPDSW